jgi:NADP-dependent aldehyde dehydrogenase
MILGNIINGQSSARSNEFIAATNPKTKEILPGEFAIATPNEISEAGTTAYDAFRIYRKTSAGQRATFLRKIAAGIMDLGSTLVDRVMAESGLPQGRVEGERGRTCDQLKQFADYLDSGEFLNAVHAEGTANAESTGINKTSIPLGPVAVFTASNFPLAFSTAGGDTAAALAAGCPVIVKGHPSHPGTNAMVSEVIMKACESCQFHPGTFSMVNGGSEVGGILVKNKNIAAVGFTGSLRGGRALMDIAARRKNPIPVYAEMGSVNPIFVLPSAIEKEDLANDVANSVNLGAGQFCTNPGLIITSQSEATDRLISNLQKEFNQCAAQTMLNEGIYQNFSLKTNAIQKVNKYPVYIDTESNGAWKAQPGFTVVSFEQYLADTTLQGEIFGPFTILVNCKDQGEVEEFAEKMEGQLTASIFGSAEEIKAHESLIEKLTYKVGRIIFNQVPTGVAVTKAMNHGGPFPAASNAKYTSVGLDAMNRFLRPICYQNAPESILPEEIKEEIRT